MSNQQDVNEALMLIFENYWLIREDNPQKYHAVKRVEGPLKRLLQERFGMRLIVHARFIKLEKIPQNAKGWMGIQAFTDVMDYVLFACAMSFTEEKGEGQPFLLNELIEEIVHDYPQEDWLDWTNYNHRRSIVRVLTYMASQQLIEIIEGNTMDFADHHYDGSKEVLYKITVYSRYFMRSYPENLDSYEGWQDMIKEQQQREDLENRVSVFRQLMLEPVIYRHVENEGEFNYLRRQQPFIETFFETHTPFALEITKDFAALTLRELSREYRYFPTSKYRDELLLQLAAFVRGQEYPRDDYGICHLTESRWTTLIGDFAEAYRGGWSKEFREMSQEKLAVLLWKSGEQWLFFRKSDVEYLIMPLFARTIGTYPPDFDPIRPDKWVAEQAEKELNDIKNKQLKQAKGKKKAESDEMFQANLFEEL
ncbi:TIGR02678 family protein [uncultured Vagococcus sp.]|uniref:TIGR02678 family protein n=1 Tax=uncultured Vagococcus sp. TaxID=189676 RepID=UPI0028D2135F|nr:TIGR02678 family protein [uncultured Vagococcus sp.]